MSSEGTRWDAVFVCFVLFDFGLGNILRLLWHLKCWVQSFMYVTVSEGCCRLGQGGRGLAFGIQSAGTWAPMHTNMQTHSHTYTCSVLYECVLWGLFSTSGASPCCELWSGAEGQGGRSSPEVMWHCCHLLLFTFGFSNSLLFPSSCRLYLFPTGLSMGCFLALGNRTDGVLILSELCVEQL